ncbi:MAG TPA: glycosyltransferase [Magnetococcales bacterium]|nr:glycosyltransferase [Magnetococcales bacterium]
MRNETCILIPFLNRLAMVAQLLEHLLKDLPEQTVVLLVDDGSPVMAETSRELSPYLKDERIHILNHPVNRGPAAARNTGIQWCRQQQIKVVILLDSDCVPDPGMVRHHLLLLERHPDMDCIGGAIIGVGSGFWAHLDRVLSWFTSLPELPAGEILAPLHLPTTNLSFRLDRLAHFDRLFEPRYKTGEDVDFVWKVRAQGGKIFFSPDPVVRHRDRETLHAVIKHQYRWALHTYIVRTGLGQDTVLRRIGFAGVFLMLSPLYVAVATYLTMRPWGSGRPVFLLYLPFVVLVYFIKIMGVLSGTIAPNQALYPETKD